MATISHASDKAKFGKEVTFGTLSGTLTTDFGHVQSVSIVENDNVEKINSVSSGFRYAKLEEGMYYVSGTMEVLATKAGLPNCFEAYFNGRTDSTDYAITPELTADYSSYSFEAEFDTTTKLQVLGAVFHTFRFSATNQQSVSISMDYVAKEVKLVAGTVSVTANEDSVLHGLDLVVNLGGTDLVATSFGLNSTWNVDEVEGRSIESVPAGQRRMIQKVIKHKLDMDGDFEVEVDGSLSLFGYENNRTSRNMTLTLERGTDNTHVLNLGNILPTTRELAVNPDNSVRTINVSFMSLGSISITGDL